MPPLAQTQLVLPRLSIAVKVISWPLICAFASLPYRIEMTAPLTDTEATYLPVMLPSFRFDMAMTAIENVLREGEQLTPDMGGKASTTSLGKAIEAPIQ